MATEKVKASARERAVRTFLQGLGIDVATGAAIVLLAWLPAADLASSAAWLILGVALAKTILTAVASYVMRLKLKPLEEAPVVRGAYVVTNLELGEDDDVAHGTAN